MVMFPTHLRTYVFTRLPMSLSTYIHTYQDGGGETGVGEAIQATEEVDRGDDDDNDR